MRHPLGLRLMKGSTRSVRTGSYVHPEDLAALGDKLTAREEVIADAQAALCLLRIRDEVDGERVTPTGLYTYPDVMVACGEMLFADERNDTLVNPCLVVEVLSRSTEDYDRGGKFAHYRSLPSVVDYLLVAQDRFHVELYTRQPDNRWLFSETDGLDGAVYLKSIDCSLKLRDVYAKHELVPAEEED